jgi:type 1 glutamine amidotransferase
MNDTEKSRWLTALVIAAHTLCFTALHAAEPFALRVLVVTGHQYPGHDWEKTTAVLRTALEQDPRVEVAVSTDVEELATRDLDAFDALVLNYANWEQPAGLSEKSRATFWQYLGRGGGLTIVHFSNGAWHHSLPKAGASDWPEFRRICRRVWDASGTSAHDRYGPFTARTTDVQHPITAGMSDFGTTDELYFNQAGDEPIVPLVVARSNKTGRDEPLAWAYRYGLGRVFQTVLGHDAPALRTAGVAQLIRRGTVWAAGREQREVGRHAVIQDRDAAHISWKTTVVDPRFRSEGVAVADVNRDGRLDVLAGEFWYEAPDWNAHALAPPEDYGTGEKGYAKIFLQYAEDLNADGWDDVIRMGFPGEACTWHENPRGAPGHWKAHTIWHSACNESPQFIDLFQDGRRVLLMGWQPTDKSGGRMSWFRPGSDPTKTWEEHPISGPPAAGKKVPGTDRFSHGLGIGDLNGDGRHDVICTGGWWAQPENAGDEPWEFHDVSLGDSCSHMYVVDVDGDGTEDVISSSAHQYGVWWHQQVPGSGGRQFITRPYFKQLVSQTHALRFADIDGDGLKDLVTGKRWWAHGLRGDPGSAEPAILYWFHAHRDGQGRLGFTPHMIHHDSGIGLEFDVVDMNADGLLDVVTSNKKGVHISQQVREEAKR